MPIDFNAHDAWTSDENVATFPSTVTTQWRLPWPRMDYDAFLLRRNDKAIISQCIYSTCTHLAAPLLTMHCHGLLCRCRRLSRCYRLVEATRHIMCAGLSTSRAEEHRVDRPP